MIANYHTHTVRCGHAVGSEREYIERAIQAGLKKLGFSDHTPMPFEPGYYSSFRMKPEAVDGYVSTLLALREEYRDDIDVLIGFEAEYYPKYFERLLKLLSDYPVDYLIMGQHFIGNEIDGSYNYHPTDDPAHLNAYVDQVLEGLSTGRFTYLAHPDLVRFTGDDATYYAPTKRLCEGAKRLGIPLEINMLGLWEGRDYPSERFFRIAAETGNDVILGVDAHQPERIGEAEVLERAERLIHATGVRLIDDVPMLRPLK